MTTTLDQLTAGSSRQRGAVLCAKRVLDIICALLLLVLVSPLLLVTAVAIKLDTPGPVLFRSTRIGRWGKPFTILKFRSMVADADPGIHQRFIKELFHGDTGQPASRRCYKLENDSRITRVGHVIRRLSVDELPQLLNVLKGDMSLVGPRPDVPYSVAEYERWQWRRFDVLPGMTGLWQISGRGELPPSEMLRLDVEYVERYSLLLDLQVLVKTVGVVAKQVGSG